MSDNDTAQIIYLVVLLAAISVGVVAAYRSRLRDGLKHAAIWGLIFLALITVASFRDEALMLLREVGSELDPAGGRVEGEALILTARSDGHFWLRAEVNDAELTFLIDSGASDIVLSMDDAKALGFNVDKLTYNRPFDTANGTIWAAPVRLERLSAGPLHLTDLSAAVARSRLETSVLGQTFLNRLESYSVSGNRMRLNP